MRDLRLAAFEKDFQKLRILCKEKEVNVNEAGPKSGRTALHWGAEAGSNEIVSYLLNAKEAVVDPLDKDLNTPLHLAIQAPISLQKKLMVIQTLLAHGADVTRENRCGETPLMNLIQLRDTLSSNNCCFQLKNINDLIVKIKKNIYVPQQLPLTHLVLRGG